MSKIIELKNDVKLRSNEILDLLGHVVTNMHWLPIFDEHNHGLVEYTCRCERAGCAHEFILSPDEYCNFELSCLFPAEPRDDIVFEHQLSKTCYYIANIETDESVNNRRFGSQLNLFSMEPTTYLEEALDRNYMLHALTKSERMEWVLCSYLKVLL